MLYPIELRALEKQETVPHRSNGAQAVATTRQAGIVVERFPILFTGLNKAMVGLGLLPGQCWVEVDEDEVAVRMGWAFRATIPRSSIWAVELTDRRVFAWGVHGWQGQWLVNGSSRNLVAIEIDPVARARVLGVPTRVLQLRVSVVDPDGLVAALS